MATGKTMDSVAPAIAMSHWPVTSRSRATDSAVTPDEQAVHGARLGPVARIRMAISAAGMFGMVSRMPDGEVASGPRRSSATACSVRPHGASAAGADDDGHPAAVPFGRVESCVRDRLPRREDGELDVLPHPVRRPAADRLVQIDAGDRAREVDLARFEFGDGAGGRDPGADPVPGGFGVVAGRGDHPQAGDDDGGPVHRGLLIAASPLAVVRPPTVSSMNRVMSARVASL